MAEPLKNSFGPDVVRSIAESITSVDPAFPAFDFVVDALRDFEPLDLLARGRQIAAALHRHLPDNPPAAMKILVSSLGPPLQQTENNGMAPFRYLPHVIYVAEYGADFFGPAMRAQYELTQRFSAEFSIRTFLERYPEKTLEKLRSWATDPNVHVRRLVSEGTRPRLPWAKRLRNFQKDPRPVLELLELLKDDPELYVRRSVANNLNDIGKDHPDILEATARRWLHNASEERRWLIGHALRSAVKRGDPGALAVLGYGKEAVATVGDAQLRPARARIGAKVLVEFDVVSTSKRHQKVLVDFRIHYRKANGKTSPKVFKLKAVELAAGESVRLSKSISLRQMTTRKHYPGKHKVDVLLNGAPIPIGSFSLVS